jgi:hypothetical protein
MFKSKTLVKLIFTPVTTPTSIKTVPLFIETPSELINGSDHKKFTTFLKKNETIQLIIDGTLKTCEFKCRSCEEQGNQFHIADYSLREADGR